MYREFKNLGINNFENVAYERNAIKHNHLIKALPKSNLLKGLAGDMVIFSDANKNLSLLKIDA